MLRIIGSILITSLLFPICAWLVFLAQNQFDIAEHPFEYWNPGIVLSLIFIVIFGLPWAPFLKARRITSPGTITLLAGAMGAMPFFLFSAYAFFGEWILSGTFPASLVSREWSQFLVLISSTAFYGMYCGIFIWLFGVYRNPWFHDQVTNAS